VFCINRHMTEDFVLDLDLRSFGKMVPVEHIVMHHDDVKAVNTAENPYNVAPTTVLPTHGPVTVPALSWNVLRYIPS